MSDCSDAEVQRISAALTQLEAASMQQKKWLRLLGAALLLACAAAVIACFGLVPARRIGRGAGDARSAALDQQGSEHWQLSPDWRGVRIQDVKGRERAGLAASGESPVFWLRDDAGRVRISAGFMEVDGAPRISIADCKSKARLVLDLNAADTPGIGFFDKNEKCRMVLTLEEDGWPSLSVFDANQACRWVLANTDGGMPQLHLFDDAAGRWDTYILKRTADGELVFRASGDRKPSSRPSIQPARSGKRDAPHAGE